MSNLPLFDLADHRNIFICNDIYWLSFPAAVPFPMCLERPAGKTGKLWENIVIVVGTLIIFSIRPRLGWLKENNCTRLIINEKEMI